MNENDAKADGLIQKMWEGENSNLTNGSFSGFNLSWFLISNPFIRAAQIQGIFKEFIGVLTN